MNKPSIAVVSCGSSKTPDSIIELFTEHVTLNKTVKENISTYSWNIDTKYYTAKVDLHPVKNYSNRDEDFNESVEAVIVYFDSNTENGLDDVKMWDKLLQDCQPDVKLLISDTCNMETKIKKSIAIEWCVKNGFELIELTPVVVDNKSEDDDEIIKETYGVERIIEALQSHLWSNLVMKNKEQAETSEKQDTNMDAMLNGLHFDDDSADFTELFQQLHMMKESVQSMPIRERRQCAEQVVTAFWRAIGGDEDEIADI